MRRDRAPEGASHAELMDSFLWNEQVRQVPVFAFYDTRRSLQVWWSGRCVAAQR